MRIAVVAAVICLSVVGVAAAGDVRAAVRERTTIAPQPLGSALQELASDRDFQLICNADLVRGLKTHGISGQFTPGEALATLLTGTGLTYQYLDARTVTVVPLALQSGGAASERPPNGPASPSATDIGTKEGKRSSSDDFRLAQTDQESSAQTSAVAQEGSGSFLEEVVVTAEKRPERLQDVPISVAILTADELRTRNIADIDDLSFAVPGLTVLSTGSYQRRIEIRGISNAFGSSSLIGMYLDEAPVSINPADQFDLNTYDLERVEVLRGPQGTLYGEGSAGGTIRFITKNPQLDAFALSSEVTALFTPAGAPGQRMQSVVNVPLVAGKLGVRVASTFDHEGGWIDQPAANQKNFNSENLTDVRTKALWQPVSELAINAMADIHRNDAPPNLGEDSPGTFVQTYNLTTTPTGRDDFNIYNVTATYDFPRAQLLSATSYSDQHKEFHNLGYRAQEAPAGELPRFDVYDPLQSNDGSSFSEEIRLTSRAFNSCNWTVGGFFQNSTFQPNGNIPTVYFALPIPPGAPLPSPIPISTTLMHSKSWSVFGDGSYKLSTRLTIGAGVRFYKDDEQFQSPLQAGTFRSVDPRFYTTFKVNSEFTIYGSAAKGFRSGGFNSFPVGAPAYGPESVWTYEGGVKFSSEQGAIGGSVDVFYSDYANYQVVGQLPPPALPFSITRNAGEAAIKGVEAATTWHVADQWSLGISGDYIHAVFTKIDLTPASSPYVVGDALDLVPKYGFTLSAQREYEWSGRPGLLRLDYNEQGPETYRNRSIGPWFYDETHPIKMLDVTVTMSWSKELSFGAFAQNLLNDRGYTSPFYINGASARSRPRTFGVQFGVDLE